MSTLRCLRIRDSVVIRNNQGLIMGAMCKLLEAGIGLAWDLGLKYIILEGDA